MSNQAIRITIDAESPIENDLDGRGIKALAIAIERLLGPESAVNIIQIQEEKDIFQLEDDGEGKIIDFRLAG
jgi:hypothetical protein